jgi:hypothetical protein
LPVAPQPFPPEATGALIEQFRQVFGGSDDLSVVERVAERPALIWPERWSELSAYADSLPADVGASVRVLIGHLGDIAAHVAGQPGWFRGNGPVGSLTARVLSGELTLDEARRIAAGADIRWRLSPDYVERCSRRAVSQAMDDRWEEALPFAQLLVASANAYAEGPARLAMLTAATSALLDVATAACIEIPDGQVLAEARSCGERLIEELEAEGESTARILFMLGVLHLDPYQAGRPLENLEAELRMWRQRFVDRYGRLALEEPGRAMPDLRESVAHAVDRFERAAAMQAGLDRALTLKAQVDAMYLAHVAGAPVDLDRLRERAEEALTLLPRDGRFDGAIAAVRKRLAACRDSEYQPQRAPEPALSAADASSLVSEQGYVRAAERYLFAVDASASSDPERAVALATAIWPHLKPQDRRTCAHPLIRAFARCGDAETLLRESGGDHSAAAARALALAPRESVLALAGLASIAVTEEREEDAVPVIGQAVAASRAGAPELTEMLRYLEAIILVGASANAAGDERWAGTTRRYAAALQLFVELGAPDEVSNFLPQALHAAEEEGLDGVRALSFSLALITPRLTRTDRPHLGRQLDEAWERLIALGAAGGRLYPELYNLQAQAAKGGAFAVMIQAGTSYDVRGDPKAGEILAARRATSVRETYRGPLMSEYLLLADDVPVNTRSGQAAAAERLEQRFDGHVTGRLTEGRDIIDALPEQTEIAGLLDDDDVLLDQFMGRDGDGAPTTFSGLQTRARRELTSHPSRVPTDRVRVEVAGQSAELSGQAFLVAGLRSALQEDPGPELANEAALGQLQLVAQISLAGIVPLLEEEAAEGRTHLCVWPHGAYHFCPMHLLPFGDGILADRWTVTYLPHAGVLRRRKQPLPAAARTLSAFGLSFSQREHGASELPAAAEEARRIAALGGEAAWTDGEATQERFVEGLLSSRYVHVATHGSQNSFAPMLQKLFLAPSSTSDGILHAYELLGLDLSHVDLVTLSACETALGRFDINDNLRGLTATLLISGVRTVISTLWPVQDAVAASFMEILYREIFKGEPKLAAFRRAQLETRRDWPAHCDWGAFVYVGSW